MDELLAGKSIPLARQPWLEAAVVGPFFLSRGNSSEVVTPGLLLAEQLLLPVVVAT